MENKQELPPGWKWVNLGEVCEIIMGQSPPSSTYNKINEGLPFFQGKADFNTYFPTVRVWCSQPIKIAEEGDVLISVRAPVGPVNISNTKCCIGRGLAGIRAKEGKTFNWYIFWYLFSIEHEIVSIGSGSTFSAISKGDLANLIIPLPPLSEQKRIAAKLQEIMQEIDQARTTCEKQLEAAKSLPSSYLREVFESPESQTWERKKLGEIVRKEKFAIVDGPFGTQLHKYDYVDSGIPLVRVQNIGSLCNFIPDNLVYITPEKFETVKRSAIHSQDILLAKTGATIGKVCLCPPEIKEGIIASSCAKISLDKNKASTEFILFFLFSKNGYQQIVEGSVGSTRPTINLDSITNISVPFLSLHEQKRIAAYLKEKIDQAEKLRSSIKKELEIINTLPQSILSKAFKGEL